MSDRSIKDEAFIGDAFKGLIDKREIADQSLYNGFKDDLMPISALSVFITAVKIYNKNEVLSDEDVDKAVEAKTYGDVRNLVDEFNPKRLAAKS